MLVFEKVKKIHLLLITRNIMFLLFFTQLSSDTTYFNVSMATLGNLFDSLRLFHLLPVTEHAVMILPALFSLINLRFVWVIV